MSLRRPPTLAIWLLNYFRVSTGNEPLAGDLLEEFRSGRTAGWYWRQTFMAIVATIGQRLRAHRQDLLALLVGWCAETSVIVALWIFHIPFGVRGWVLELPMLAIILILMYVEIRVQLHLWMNSDEEVDQFMERRIRPRIAVLMSFLAWVVCDVIIALLAMLPGIRFSLSYIFMYHGGLLCDDVIGRLRRAS